jgi:hypothetical protein
MNAADVIRDGTAEWSPAHTTASEAPGIVAALLAHGEQGVAILKDGTLWALRGTKVRTPENDYGSTITFSTAYLLVPLSAEAGDTDD